MTQATLARRQAAPTPITMTIAAVRNRLEEAIQRCLRDGGYSELHDVDCTCVSGRAVLTGRVSSYHMKQMAQVLVRNIEGVLRIDNLLTVVTSAT